MSDAPAADASATALAQAWHLLSSAAESEDDEARKSALLAIMDVVKSLAMDADAPSVFPSAMQASQDAAASYVCKECGRKFASEKGLANHYATVHADDDNEGDDK